jgi:opine dehydrogenase
MTKQVIAVLGGGNAGHASAAELSLLGFECRLYQDQRFAGEMEKVFKTKEIMLGRDPEGGCRVEGRASISVVTSDLKEAVAGADVILCHLPAFAHKGVAENLAELVEDGQLVVLLPGTLGSLEVAEVFRRKGVKKDVIIAETNTNPYDTMVLAPGESFVYKMNDPLMLGVFPAVRTEEAMTKLEGVYKFVPMTDVLECAIHSHNPLLHTPACIMSISRIERSKGEFYLYEEAFTDTVCRVTKEMDEERIALGNAFGYKTLNIEQLLSGLEDPGTLFKETNGNAGLCYIKGPTSVKSRYFTEDGLHGLVPWSQLGEMAGVDTPLMKAFATIEGSVIQRDIWKEGRTLEVMGIQGMNVETFKEYMKTGNK